MPTRFVRFADSYRTMVKKQCRSLTGCDVGDLMNRPYAAMVFWTTKVHERAGTNPLFPAFHRRALEETLERPSDRRFSDAVKTPRFAEGVWQKFKHNTSRGGKERSNENLTFGPVKGIVVKLKQEGEPNVLKWLTSMKPQEAWEALQMKPNLKGIGPKLASFVLRDVAVFCNGWKDEIENKGKFFQPVDRWVLRCARSVWPDESWPSDITGGRADYLKLAEKIVKHCADDVEAMNFNMGAWFVNARFQDIMAIHGLLYFGESLSPEMTLRLIDSFNADRISRAVCCDAKEIAVKLGA